MPTFLAKAFNTYFKNILGMNQSANTGVDATTRVVHDGAGNSTSISLSDDVLSVQPVNDNTTGTMLVKNQGGSNILAVDTTNSKILGGASQTALNTQYAYFGTNSVDSLAFIANTHFAIPFSVGGFSATQSDVDFGTGTDPDDSFTTSGTDSELAGQLVPMLWRVPDNITIDSVSHIEGADASAGDTTRMHLKSYTFTSASTSCLTSGTLLAHNSDIANDGNEQAYLSTWSLDSADVDAGKVILCFFRQDGVNSDFSINATVKYHIR